MVSFKHLSGLAPDLVKRFNRSLHACMRHLSDFVLVFLKISLSAARKLRRWARSSAKGVFPPIGVASMLALTAATIGVHNLGAGARSVPYYIVLAIGIIFGVLLWKVPRGRYNALFASIFGWLPVFLGAVSYIFWYWYAAGYMIGGEFFHAAADVLPILLLATVVDVAVPTTLRGSNWCFPLLPFF